MKPRNKAHFKIAPDDMQAYIRRDMTSKELARRSGYSAVYLRRSIERAPQPERSSLTKAEATKLRRLRQAFRQSISHLPTSKIAKLAHVSSSTALRIKKKYQKEAKDV